VSYIADILYSGVGKKLGIVVKKVANPESLALFEPFFNSEEMARQSRRALSRL
jgi:hypothetical protein